MGPRACLHALSQWLPATWVTWPPVCMGVQNVASRVYGQCDCGLWGGRALICRVPPLLPDVCTRRGRSLVSRSFRTLRSSRRPWQPPCRNAWWSRAGLQSAWTQTSWSARWASSRRQSVALRRAACHQVSTEPTFPLCAHLAQGTRCCSQSVRALASRVGITLHETTLTALPCTTAAPLQPSKCAACGHTLQHLC